MKIILTLLNLFFSFLVVILNTSDMAYGIGNVDWILLKENNDGKEWLDMGVLSNLEIMRLVF